VQLSNGLNHTVGNYSSCRTNIHYTPHEVHINRWHGRLVSSTHSNKVTL